MTTYTITERNGCRLVSGSVSLSSFGMLCHGMPEGSVMDTNVARLLGVAFAIGLPEDLKSLVDSDVRNEARIKVEKANPGLSGAAKEWLAVGEHGTSSLTIFGRLTGTKQVDCEMHPSDPDDLRRCRLLLECVPELAQRFEKMAEASPVWARLAANWEELCALMDEEAPEWRESKGRAPKTYARMKELIG